MRWEPTRPRTSVSHRPNTTAARDWAWVESSWSHPVAKGPIAKGLTRAGRPGPSAIGSTRSARHSASYSSLVSPRINVRYPKSIIRRQNALVVADLPVPGLPKLKMLGLVTGTSSRNTHPNGSQWNAVPESMSMPSCAPGRWQPGGGDERPQRGRLVTGHPPRRHWGAAAGPTHGRGGGHLLAGPVEQPRRFAAL